MAVGHVSVHGHGTLLLIDGKKLFRRFHGQELFVAIGYFVEAMASSQNFQLRLFAHKIPPLLQGIGGIQVFRAVLEITGPVFQFEVWQQLR